MANCHKNFFTATDSYHSKVTLDGTKKESLKTSRNKLRAHLKKEFSEKNRPSIKFQMQGSFAMKTTVNPLNGDYDIDDGLYFKPQLEERPTPETVHRWVTDAAASYPTVDPPVDKNKCVRVPFKAGYHIDIPIYDLVKEDDDNALPYLAVKGDGWIFSDPKKLTGWFDDEVSKHNNNGQLRRVVRYLKAWADFENQSSRSKIPCGLILTILAAEEFQDDYGDNDDEAFGNTASVIRERLLDDDSISNPVDEDENLRDRISDAQFNNFMERLRVLVESADTAIDHQSEEEAAKEWKKRLGDRFPVYEDEDSTKAKTFGAVTVGNAIKVNTGSAT
ncbi:MAG: CBASS cGAMP synthase [Deltaproteobacteria bacterium]|nr:CBASS cGAMP synthase [Deltaproteobacteria bacterium]